MVAKLNLACRLLQAVLVRHESVEHVSQVFKSIPHVAKPLVQGVVDHALLEEYTRRDGEEEVERRRREPNGLLLGFRACLVDRPVLLEEIEGGVDIHQLIKKDLLVLGALHPVITTVMAHDIRFRLPH